MTVEVVNFTRRSDLEKKVAVLAGKIIKLAKIKNGDLSVALVGERKMRAINHQWREQNKVTDVLSFSLAEEESKNIISGEIFICPSQIARQAEKNKESFHSELTRILVHGILHLLGYEHEQKKKDAELMFAKQEQLLKKLK